MAQLQEEILSIQEYFRSVEYYGKGLVVKVAFPSKWTVYPSEDGKIKVASDDTAEGVYFYYVDLNDASLEDVFALIKETVAMNLEALKKITLMREKIDELKEIFASKSIDELSTLQFTFGGKKKPKRKYNRKKVKEEEAVEEVLEVTKEEEIVEDNNGNS